MVSFLRVEICRKVLQCLSIGDGDGLSGDWGSSDETFGGYSDGGSGKAMSVGEVAGIDVGDWGSGDHGLVDGEGGMVNHWGLDDLVNWVDLVGLCDWNWVFNFDSVWLGNVLLDDDFPLNWNWVGNWNLDGNAVHLKFGLDALDLWGDDGVGADWGEDLFLGNGISWSWSIVAGCWRDDWASWGWDDWGWELNSGRVRLWLSGNVGEGWLLFKGLSGNDVLVSGKNLLASNLDSARSNDSVVDDGLSNCWSGVDGFNGGQWGCAQQVVWGGTAQGEENR